MGLKELKESIDWLLGMADDGITDSQSIGRELVDMDYDHMKDN